MDKLPIVFMYSGQGSHYYQMGRELFENNIVFKHHLQLADDILKTLTGFSVIKEMYNPEKKKSDPFTVLTETHPAIYILEYALTQVLRENDITPDWVLGSSIGEFAAAESAGIFNLETGLQLITQQAESIQTCCEKGAMLAILADATLFERDDFINQKSELAGINFPANFVVSGKESQIDEIATHLKNNKIASQRLAVEYAFHSSLIDTAQNLFLKQTKSVTLSQIHLPFISCASKEVMTEFNISQLWECVRLPMLFNKIILSQELKAPYLYIDVGPSGTLATFIKYNLSPASHSKYFPILTPFGNDTINLGKLLNYLRNP